MLMRKTDIQDYRIVEQPICGSKEAILKVFNKIYMTQNLTLTFCSFKMWFSKGQSVNCFVQCVNIIIRIRIPYFCQLSFKTLWESILPLMYVANLLISDIAVQISPKQEFLQPCIFPHFLKWSNKNSGFLLWCLFLKAGGGGVVLNIDWSPLKKNVGIFLAIDYKYV